jgi:hypothetical protein
MSVRPARFVFGPGPRNGWQAELYRPGGDNQTQRMRRHAFPRNSNSDLQCGYCIERMGGRVIRTVVPCTLHQSRNRLAGRSRLDAILLGLLLSELETSPTEFTLAYRLSKA